MWNQLGKDRFRLSTGNSQFRESSVAAEPGAPPELELVLDPEYGFVSGAV